MIQGADGVGPVEKTRHVAEYSTRTTTFCSSFAVSPPDNSPGIEVVASVSVAAVLALLLLGGLLWVCYSKRKSAFTHSKAQKVCINACFIHPSGKRKIESLFACSLSSTAPWLVHTVALESQLSRVETPGQVLNHVWSCFAMQEISSLCGVCSVAIFLHVVLAVGPTLLTENGFKGLFS
jgi:hypothetical protein